MGVTLQTIVVGLSAGVVYGLVAIGFSLVWSLTRTLPFAHGDIVVASVLFSVFAILGTTPVAASLGIGRSLGLVLLTLVTGPVLAVLSYVVAVRPFVSNSAGWVAATLLVGVSLRALLGLAFPATGYAVPDPLHLDGLTHDGVVGLPQGATVQVRSLAVLVIGLVVAAAAGRFVWNSRPGRAMRAVAADREAAALCGVSVEVAALTAFALAGVLAAIAGLLEAPDRTVTVDSGVALGLAGAAGATLGGLGSPVRAVGGGLVVGLLQQAAVAIPALGAQWSDVVPVVVLVAALAMGRNDLVTGLRPVLE